MVPRDCYLKKIQIHLAGWPLDDSSLSLANLGHRTKRRIRGPERTPPQVAEPQTPHADVQPKHRTPAAAPPKAKRQTLNVNETSHPLVSTRPAHHRQYGAHARRPPIRGSYSGLHSLRLEK